MSSIIFKKGDRVVDKTIFPIFPMTIQSVGETDWDTFYIQCDKDFDNDFINKSRKVLKADAKLFSIQKPNYVVFVKYNFKEEFKIELPYFDDSPDIGLIWAFLEKYLNESYKRFIVLGDTKEKVKGYLLNIFNDEKLVIQRMKSTILNLYKFPSDYENYYHIEYSQVEKLFYFDCFKQDTNTLLTTTLALLISLMQNTKLNSHNLKLIIDSI